MTHLACTGGVPRIDHRDAGPSSRRRTQRQLASRRDLDRLLRAAQHAPALSADREASAQSCRATDRRARRDRMACRLAFPTETGSRTSGVGLQSVSRGRRDHDTRPSNDIIANLAHDRAAADRQTLVEPRDASCESTVGRPQSERHDTSVGARWAASRTARDNDADPLSSSQVRNELSLARSQILRRGSRARAHFP